MPIKTTVVGSYPVPDWLAALPSELHHGGLGADVVFLGAVPNDRMAACLGDLLNERIEFRLAARRTR